MIVRRLVVPRIISTFFSQQNTSTSPESTNQLIKTLTKHGNYDRAFQLFDRLVEQNNVSIISLLNILETCTRSSQIERTNEIEQFINQSQQWKNNIRLQTSLINMHMKCQRIDQAERIFEKIRLLPQCDIVVYNAMLKGYLQNHQAQRCLDCFDRMHSTISPDYVTYILILNACSALRNAERGIVIHRQIPKIEHVHLQNALIDFYGRINRIKIAEEIFEQMHLRETSSFNTLMKAYLLNKMPMKVLELFEQMKQSDRTNLGPIGYRPDLITFMAVCDACEKLGLLTSPESSYGEFTWQKIFSKRIE